MNAGGYAVAPPGVALRCHDKQLGRPVHHFTYKSADGGDLVHVDYYTAAKDAPSINPDGLVARYWLYDPQSGAWEARRGVPPKSILYRLDELATTTSPLVICPTEADADHLNALPASSETDSSVFATTWLGPDSRAASVDLAPLGSRSVTILATMGSLEACGALGAALYRAGIKPSILDPRRVPGLPGEWTPRKLRTLGELWELAKHAVSIAVAPPESKAARPAGTVSVARLPLIERWREWGFALDHKSLPYQNTSNVKRYLAHHPKDYGDVWLDLYRQQIRYGIWDGNNREWGDADDIVLQLMLQTEAGLHYIAKSAVHDALIAHAHENCINPYARERDATQWDNVPRLEEAFHKGWGTPNDAYHRAAGRCFFIQQAMRALEPGCKADLMFIFEGPTGKGKSSSLISVFGEQNVAEPTSHFGTPNFYQEILGKSVVEIADLHNFKGASLESIKADVSRQRDRFRPPYGRYAEDFPRQCVFVGTTERSDWNEDPALTARRFPPVECGKIDLDYLRENATQLLAEAWARAKRHEPYWDLPYDDAVNKQRARVPDDPMDSAVASACKGQRRTTVLEVCRMMGVDDITKITPALSSRVTKALRKLGWLTMRSGRERYWAPGPEAEADRPQKDMF